MLLRSPGLIAAAKPVGGGGGYTGPLDLVPGAVVAYGQRALSAAKRGSALYTISRDSDDTTQSFNSDASTGDAPASAISSFIGGGNGFVTLWNDQTAGGQDLSGNATFPWENSVFGSHPAIASSVGGSANLNNSTFSCPAGAYTDFIVAYVDASIGPVLINIKEGVDNLFQIGEFYNVAGDVYVVVGASPETDWATTGTTTTAAHIFETVVDDSGNAAVFVDGIDLTATVQSGTPQTVPAVTNGEFALTFGAGDALKYAEILRWNSAISSADRLAIRQNIAAYYGITLS